MAHSVYSNEPSDSSSFETTDHENEAIIICPSDASDQEQDDSEIQTSFEDNDTKDRLGVDIWNDTLVEKRHSFDVSHLGKRESSPSETEIRARVPASKSVEDISTKCKTQRRTSGGDFKQTLARLLGKSVSSRVRSFIDLFSSSEDNRDAGRDKKKKTHRRKNRYKEDERSAERYEPITIYTKLKKNQWKLRMTGDEVELKGYEFAGGINVRKIRSLVKASLFGTMYGYHGNKNEEPVIEIFDTEKRICRIAFELRKAFLMFEKGGKNKMAARDLGELLRCLGWNPSERELEEAKHELVVSARGSVSFSEIERYVARRGGICNGCKDEDDIQEAFQVLDQDGDGKISVHKFKHFMTTLGEKMSDKEVDEILQSLKKDRHNAEYLEYKDIIEGLETTVLEDS